MTTAYLLINVEIGKGEEVKERIKEIEFVKEVHGVYGIYDVLAKLEGPDEKLRETVTWNIRRLPNVKSTITMLTSD
jgi:DNA-binding Lrp family transcriptional regulator